MTLNYNSTDSEHIKARQNVVPPSVEEMRNIVANLNFFLSDMPDMKEKLQQVLYDYENKSHFYTVTGGWDGYNKLKGSSDVKCNKCKGYDLTNDATLTCNPPIRHYICNCCGNEQIEKS